MASTKITEFDMEDSVFDSITTKLEELSTKLDSMSTSAVKSVQRGSVVYYNSSSSDYYVDVTISTVNMEKTTVKCTERAILNHTGLGGTWEFACELIDANTLRIYSNTARKSTAAGHAIYWEVVEFN